MIETRSSNGVDVLLRQSRGKTASPTGTILLPAVLGAAMASDGDIPASPAVIRALSATVVFCALHGQLANLDRHAQLMRCCSVVAELLF